MIVRVASDRIQLITQPDHAHLSRRIMERCAALEGHARRGAILHAIGEHDNGWAEEDRAPIADPTTGGVVDFVALPAAVRQRVWPRGVARLARDPWAAALVAQHAIAVYDRFRADSEWTSFFSEMGVMRVAHLRASGLRLDDLLTDYPFVRLGDLISLAFCTGSPAPQQFGRWTVQLSGSRVVVSPDAFAGATVPLEIAAKEIRGRLFRSDLELLEALRGAPTSVLSGEVAGATRP